MTERLPSEIANRWSVFVFATMPYAACHARMHAMVEACIRLGLDATYVEAPNSNSAYHPGTGAPSLNRGGWRLAPPQRPERAADGTGVLCVPKKWSVGPVRVAFGRRRQERLQGAWLARFFAGLRATAGRRALAIVSTARWQPALEEVPFDLVVYDKLDPPEVLRGWLSEREYLEREDRLVARSALNLAITSPLERALRARHAEIATRLVPNGVDCVFFDARSGDPVPELAGAPRPVAGFLGSVASWVDLELLAACARAHPKWTFPVFGPVGSDANLSPLAACDNVRCYGSVDYARVPAIMSQFDVGLLPFRPGAFSDNANPVTLYEYLALGKPVVTTPLADAEECDGAVLASRDQFIANLARAVEPQDGSLVARRRAIAERHGWDALMRGTLDALPL
jgi:glycosyltransferase involved in cell wall biosynthesis